MDSTRGEFVRLEVDGGIGTIRLDRPPMNVLNRQVQQEVSSAAQQAAAARRWAQQFVTGPGRALAAAKAAIDDGLDVDLGNGLRLEAVAFAALANTEDGVCGMRSFLDHGPGKARFIER